MVTGLPGAGIGGLFYLAAALVLPFRTAVRRLRGERRGWRVPLAQSATAGMILVVIWLAGAAIGLWAGPVFRAAGLPGAAGTPVGTSNLLATVTLAVSLVTLAVVLLSVQLARVLVRRPPSARGRR